MAEISTIRFPPQQDVAAPFLNGGSETISHQQSSGDGGASSDAMEVEIPPKEGFSSSSNAPSPLPLHLVPRSDSSDVDPVLSPHAVRLQKVYRSYRTRRRLADSAVVAEELWWQAIDFARLNHSTISFFSKPETAASKWSRALLNASKVGKGLSKDEKALKLAFQHWIEAIDPRHRYGHNLHIYYDEWCKCDAGQPFFYWLDIGDGRNIDLKECPRSVLREQIVKYLGPQEREHYEYEPTEGKIVHVQTRLLLDTTKGSTKAKWIFVMSTSKKLYIGQKTKGLFHHSSFLAGGATMAAGRLIVENGIPKSLWAYSGHYRPSVENLNSFLSYLSEKGIDRKEIEIFSSTNEDYYTDSEKSPEEKPVEAPRSTTPPKIQVPPAMAKNLLLQAVEVPDRRELAQVTLAGGLQSPRPNCPQSAILCRLESKGRVKSYQLGDQLSMRWSSGLGPRIGCVADYPVEVRAQALECVNLSPKVPTPSTYRYLTSKLSSMSPASVSTSATSV